MLVVPSNRIGPWPRARCPALTTCGGYRQADDSGAPPGMRLLPEDERLALVESLKAKWDQVPPSTLSHHRHRTARLPKRVRRRPPPSPACAFF